MPADRPPPLVSVVIPTYERPQYLRIALASVLAQTYPRIEVIVHDNASPTDPTSVIADFGDPRVALYRNARNLGITGNAAAACRKAGGKYVALLGDDDAWRPDFLATLVGALEAHEDAVIAFCDHDIIAADGQVDAALTEAVTRRYGRHLLREGVYRPFDEIALVHRSICVLSGAVLRRDAVAWEDLPLGLTMGLDIYLAYLAARTGKACCYSPRRLAQYRYHAGSASSSLEDIETRIGNARDAIFYWNRFLLDAALPRNKRYFEMKRGLNALVIVVQLLRRGERHAALRELRRFLREGLIRPRIFFYHLLYSLRLHRATA